MRGRIAPHLIAWEVPFVLHGFQCPYRLLLLCTILYLYWCIATGGHWHGRILSVASILAKDLGRDCCL